MSRWAAAALMFLAVFLCVKTLAELVRMPNIGKEVYPQSTIMVTGKGEAYAIPDIATFSFSVIETAKTAKLAQDAVNQKMDKALSSLKDSGIEEKDIKTTNYSVYPKYEWTETVCSELNYPNCPRGKNVLVGYEVNQSIMVKVRDTEKAGDLVTKVGAIGVENISGVEFSIDDREKYVAEAREEAIADAKTKAKELSKQLGVKLGKIMYYNDNSTQPYYGYAEGKGGGMDLAVSSVAPVAQLPTGETKITSEISITYEIR